jgi:uncharacterized RDD family membrane protein YckC
MLDFLLGRHLPPLLTALLMIVSNSAWIVYAVILHKRYGQTVGKMVTKVRVVDYRTEGAISWKQAFLRDGLPTLFLLLPLYHDIYRVMLGVPYALVSTEGFEAGMNASYWIMQMLPGLWLLAELVTMLTNEKRRALHDFIGGTVVIRTNLEEDRTWSIRANPSPADAPPLTSE